MGTVSKKIADGIIAGKYPEDRAARIVEYVNMGGELAHGVTSIYEDPNKYLQESEFIRRPRIYWQAGHDL